MRPQAVDFPNSMGERCARAIGGGYNKDFRISRVLLNGRGSATNHA